MELNVKTRTPSTDIESNKEITHFEKEKATYINIHTKEEETERNQLNKPSANSLTIDKDNSRFPYCIVWTPIPCLTTIFPFIGHTGICNSSGIIHDFAGSYYVSIDNMAFGSPCKYIQLNPSAREMVYWDKAIQKGDDIFNTEQHNLIT